MLSPNRTTAGIPIKAARALLPIPTTANGNKTITTTQYINGAVFESRTISPADPNVIKEFVDDYFVKDHLGNIPKSWRRSVGLVLCDS